MALFKFQNSNFLDSTGIKFESDHCGRKYSFKNGYLLAMTISFDQKLIKITQNVFNRHIFKKNPEFVWLLNLEPPLNGKHTETRISVEYTVSTLN